MSREFPSLFSAPQASAGFLLRQAAHRWQRAQRDALAPLELTPAQFILLAGLSWLADDPEPVTQSRLATHAAADPMMTSQVVRTLEKKGLLRRETAPGDKRARTLRLTAQGERLAGRALAVVERVDESFFGDAGLPPEKAAAIFTRLGRA